MADRGQTGKLDARRLESLLRRFAPAAGRGVLVGPGIGLDAAAVAVRGGALVLASDPVTYAAEHIGRYAVHVNANDVFCLGAEPAWFLADVLLPPGDGAAAEAVFRDIHRACRELDVAVVGGHTELTPGLARPIVAGFMIGRLPRGRRPITAAGVRPGDAIILTKGAGIEGTAIIARQRGGELAGVLSATALRRARAFLRRPGLSVGPEARAARALGATAMHDPTEGGVLNGLWELARAGGVAIEVDPARVAVAAETRALCDRFGLDPLKLLGSGALLIACRPRRAGPLLAALARRNIGAARIGSAARGQPIVRLADGRTVRSAITDEILKLM